jgi:tripartite-type tricarboxylate transporter receptor subunit TctC
MKPVRLIEPFGAGGGPDLVGRALAQKLTEFWGSGYATGTLVASSQVHLTQR